ncbi:hypothetical protein [Bradyrhizobium amphicarpaeae]|uniref:Uncharacterized protein n=1 Tax=Bradyrhizobium amphicarpaeae TaxID=1404768 RepID=A0A2U8PN04_9BRAD|nr:hypothetical protein [Bradyrhizobium amphicarpaeae]AWL99148.1 hypothetical protein CIT40_03365 [Bradyrhizobium amphicarpaeae]
MTNVIQFHSKHRAREAPQEITESSTHLRAAALCASARDALCLLTGQFELAIHHARAIESRIRDIEARQQFADRIELTQRLLEIARLKILLL